MRRATAALVSGVLLSAGVPAGWLLSDGGSPPEYGQAVARSLRERPAPVTAPVLRPPIPTRAGPAVRTTSARAADVLVRPDPPAAVRFAGRRAPVDPVGLDADRRVVVPSDVRRAGWYEPGPAPGDRTGSAVLVGHVDDRDQGLGTFAGLRDLRAGDGVVV